MKPHESARILRRIREQKVNPTGWHDKQTKDLPPTADHEGPCRHGTTRAASLV